MKTLFTGPEADTILKTFYPQLWEIIDGPDFPLLTDRAADMETKTAFIRTTKNWLEGGSIEPVFFQQIGSLPGLAGINTNVTGCPREIEIIINL